MKDKVLNIRIDKETLKKLEELSQKDLRTKSDYIRLLIHKAYVHG